MEREMKNRSITVTSLARMTEIPRTTLHDWISGRLPSSKNIHHLSKLSDFFNVSLNELLFGTQDKNYTSEILSCSTFKDGKNHYKVTIEKMENK
jgi:hypothetical protein